MLNLINFVYFLFETPSALTHLQSSIVWRICVKIALNLVKGSKLLQMKLITKRSKLGLGAFREFSALVPMLIWLLQTKAFH